MATEGCAARVQRDGGGVMLWSNPKNPITWLLVLVVIVGIVYLMASA